MLDPDKLQPHVETRLPYHRLEDARQAVRQLQQDGAIVGKVYPVTEYPDDSHDRGALHTLQLIFEHEADLQAFREACETKPRCGMQALDRATSRTENFLFETFFDDADRRFLANDFYQALDAADGEDDITVEHNRRMTEFMMLVSEVTDRTGSRSVMSANARVSLDTLHDEYEAFRERVAREYGEKRREARRQLVAQAA